MKISGNNRVTKYLLRNKPYAHLKTPARLQAERKSHEMIPDGKSAVDLKEMVKAPLTRLLEIDSRIVRLKMNLQKELIVSAPAPAALPEI